MTRPPALAYILASTRIRAILRGTVAGRAQIGNLTADSRIKPGEQVLTSGGDQVYPRGLPVGTIESIAPDPDHQPYAAITVRPAVNLDRVEEVLVITGTQPDCQPPASRTSLPPRRSTRPTSAPSACPAFTTTRFPPRPASMQPPATPPTPGPTTPPVVAHPLPACPPIHPDRYSSEISSASRGVDANRPGGPGTPHPTPERRITQPSTEASAAFRSDPPPK